MSFFGADKNTTNGEFVWNGGERIPEEGWKNRPTPYSEPDILLELLAMYLENPVLFGANSGPGNFDGLNLGSYFRDGKLNEENVAGVGCALYLALALAPSATGELVNLPVELANAITARLAPFLENLGCPNNFNDRLESPGGSLAGP